MKIYLKDGKYNVYIKDFPMTVFELQDTLDQMKITKNNSKVLFKISKYDNVKLPQNLCEQEICLRKDTKSLTNPAVRRLRV